MTPWIDWDDGQLDTVNKHLEKFAKQGLRTLMMAKKEISQNEVEWVIDEITEIENEGGKDKKDKLEAVYTTVEEGLQFVGGSAIEDQLQEYVPETIAKLIEAEIRVWVLTGDKQETAIEIGKLCRLVDDTFDQILLNIKIKDDDNVTFWPVETCESEVMKILEAKLDEVWTEGFELPDKIKKTNLEQIN